MAEKEVVRIVRGAKTAVLMVHGICGTLRHFDDFLPLVPEDMSVAAICLDGHGAAVKDFSRTSMEKWKAQVEKWVQDLSIDHERIIVVGHSMGTLLTARLVEQYPRIRGMLLLDVPLHIWLAPVMIPRCLRFCFGKLREDVPAEQALRQVAGIDPDPKIWRYIGWIPRFWELLQLCRESRSLFEDMKIPCHVFQSANDELVLPVSSKYLVGKTNVHHRIMEKSGHFDYAPEEFSKVLCCFEDLLKQ